MTKKESKLLLKIKKLSLEFYVKNQLPKCLVQLIQKQDHNSSVALIEFLSESCEMYLRVVGFYKKYPLENQKVDIELHLRMKEKGLI